MAPDPKVPKKRERENVESLLFFILLTYLLGADSQMCLDRSRKLRYEDLRQDLAKTCAQVSEILLERIKPHAGTAKIDGVCL